MSHPGTPTPAPHYPPVRGEAGRVNWLSAFAGFAVGLVLATLVWVQVLPPDAAVGGDQADLTFVPPEDVEALQEELADTGGAGPRTRVTRTGGEAGEGGDGGQAGEGGEAAGAGGIQVGGGQAGGGSGGGGTGDDRAGVADNVIRLGATVAESGLASAFLGEVRLGMEAVRTRVNRAGGIEGRQLEILYKDDAWDSTRGKQFIENLIREENVFALAVSPSSEGLNAASEDGVFKDHGVPVVGADGLNNSQFIDIKTGEANPWIWPVASATTTQAHIIMQNAWERAKAAGVELRPAIVFGNTYKFGVEGSYAFNQAFRDLSGTNIPGFQPGGQDCRQNSRFCGVEAGRGSYTGEISTVQSACDSTSIGGGRCNFLLLLLEPASALTWMGDARAAEDWRLDGGCCGMAGAQPLFTENFAAECKRKCHTMMLWTGYNPVCCSSGNEDVAEFARALPPRADENNQFTMGGYLGMTLLVQALEQVGSDLTRSRLVEALNSMTLRTGLTHPDGLTWSPRGKYANLYAQAKQIDYGTGFNGFQPSASFTKDPWPGQHNQVP